VYWRWNRIPELADLPPEERKRLWTEARRDPFRMTDLAWFALVLGVAIGAGLALIWLPRGLNVWIELPAFLILFLGVGALVDAILILRYRPIVRRLRGGQASTNSAISSR
jgi:hypothetical protein